MSILETGTQVKNIVVTEAGWYFYFKDYSCRIGPYQNVDECQKDFDQYLKTGRISNDEKRKIVKEG